MIVDEWLQKPIALHGHERAITQIRYNKDGDLLFSAAKDHSPNVWFSINGERLGTFEGHSGAVWSIDVSWDSRLVLTGAADNTARLWDCETGKEISKFITNTAVRTVNFSYSGDKIFFTTDQAMKYPYVMSVIDIRDNSNENIFNFENTGTKSDEKPSSALWGPLDEYLITGHDNGILTKWDLRNPDNKLLEVQRHKKTVTDMQYSKDQTMIVTSSRDCSAMVSEILVVTYFTRLTDMMFFCTCS